MQVTIDVPPEIEAILRMEVASGRFADPSAYLLALVKAALEHDDLSGKLGDTVPHDRDGKPGPIPPNSGLSEAELAALLKERLAEVGGRVWDEGFRDELASLAEAVKPVPSAKP